MCDDESGPSMHQLIHTILYQLLRSGINRRSRFIQDQHRRIRYRCTGDRQKLSLPLAQIGTVIRQFRLIAIRQSPDKSIRIRQFSRRDHLFIRSIQLSVTDIFHNRIRKQLRILKNNPQRPTQICFFDLVDINTIITDLSILDIIKTVDQIGDRGLSCSGRTNKCNLLTRFCKELDIMQNHLFLIISKIHTIKYHITFQRLISCCIIRFVVMFPCPVTCMFLCFPYLTILNFRINQCNIPFVQFRFFIQDTEDTVCTCQCHNHTV